MIDSLEPLATFDTLHVPETVHEGVDADGVPEGLPERSAERVEADERRVEAEERAAGAGAAMAVAEGNAP